MCSIPTAAKVKKAQSTSCAPMKSVPSPGARRLTAAAANAGAKCPMNMGVQLANRNVAQVAIALAVAVAKVPQMISSTLTWVAQTLNTAWLVRSKVA